MTEEGGDTPIKQRKPRYKSLWHRIKVTVGKLKHGMGNLETAKCVCDAVGDNACAGGDGINFGDTAASTSLRRAVSSHAATTGGRVGQHDHFHPKSFLDEMDNKHYYGTNFALPDVLQVNYDDFSDISSVTTSSNRVARNNNYFDFETTGDIEIEELFETFEAALDGALSGMLEVVGNGVELLGNSKATSCKPNGCTGMSSDAIACSHTAIGSSPILQCADYEQDENMKSMMDDFLCRDERSHDSFSNLDDFQELPRPPSGVGLDQAEKDTEDAAEEDALQHITNLVEKAEEDLELILGSLNKPTLVNSEGVPIGPEVSASEESDENLSQNPASSLSKNGSTWKKKKKKEKRPRLRRKRFGLKLEPSKLKKNVLRRFRRKQESRSATKAKKLSFMSSTNSVILTESGGEESGSKETAETGTSSREEYEDSDSGSSLVKITVVNLTQEVSRTFDFELSSLSFLFLMF